MPNPADTLTLEDLKNWNRRDEAGNFLPSLAVLGHPVAHSVSPQMHNAALAELAKTYPQFQNWKYYKFEIKPEELKEALDLLKEKNFVGVNLTVPHKHAAAIIFGRDNINTTGEVGIEKTPVTLAAFSSVNTVVFNGRLPHDNTDGYGLARALKQDLGKDISGNPIVILGTGGAASGAADECLNHDCSALWIGGREEQKRLNAIKGIKKYISDVLKLEPTANSKIKGFDLLKPLASEWPPDVIVINATTLGMKRNDPLPFDVSLLGNKACVFDMVYNREGPTKFVVAARERGLRAADGLGMLVWQGAKSLTIWIKAHEGIDIQPEAIAPTMMTAACAALGLPPRHA